MDGFFLTGREADPDFSWRTLEGAEVVMFKGGQPNAMFRYACHKAGIDFAKIRPITHGGAADIDRAFRDGLGQYVQQRSAARLVGQAVVSTFRIQRGAVK